MNKSKCKVCGSVHTIKYGTRNGVQTYRCADCGYRFRNERLPSDREIWRLYQENKQTAAELAVMLGTSPSTIKRRLRNITITWGQSLMADELKVEDIPRPAVQADHDPAVAAPVRRIKMYEA